MIVAHNDKHKMSLIFSQFFKVGTILLLYLCDGTSISVNKTKNQETERRDL